MNSREVFSRNKENKDVLTSEKVSTKEENKIFCDTLELKKWITDWTKNEGWEFKDFVTFVELIGVKTPIKLSDWNKEEDSFKCITALNTEVTIHIVFGDWMDLCSELWVTEGEETRKYFINRNYRQGKYKPNPILWERSITRNCIELRSFYCLYFCNRTLKLDDTHVLKVEINEPVEESSSTNAKVLRNYQEVEDYLLDLDNSLVMTQVYDRVMELLGFSDEDISNSEKILFSYIEIVGEEERTISKIFKVNGKIKEYAVHEDGETFQVSKNGSWMYQENATTIMYIKELDEYVFSVTGTESRIINADPIETMNCVKEKISKLMDYVK